MIIISDSYLVSAKINVGQFFGKPDAEAFIELREPDTRTMFKINAAFKTGDNEKIVETFLGVLPGLIVAHPFMKSQTEAMSQKEATEVIASKLDLFMHVLTGYKEQVLFTQGKKSDEK